MKTIKNVILTTLGLIAAVPSYSQQTAGNSNCAANNYIVADSGAGRNGPDHCGIAIPPARDRALTWAKFNAAVKVCKGYALADLMSQILRTRISQPFLRVPGHHPLYDNFTLVTPNPDDQTSVKLLSISARLSFRYEFPNYENHRDINHSLAHSHLGLLKDFPTEIAADRLKDYPNVVPVDSNVFDLMARTIKDDAFFNGGFSLSVLVNNETAIDELGNLDRNQITVTKWTSTYKPFTRFVDTKDVSMPFQLNPKGLTECIQRNIQ